MNFNKVVMSSAFMKLIFWRINPSWGAVKKNGEVDISILRDVYEQLDGDRHPWRYAYALVHGSKNLISTYYNVAEPENVYKEALKKNTTWEKLINFKAPPDDALL